MSKKTKNTLLEFLFLLLILAHFIIGRYHKKENIRAEKPGTIHFNTKGS
jgi:hypothetical protein